MMLASDRGDFDRAALSQRELARLGWRVTREGRRPRRQPRQPLSEVAAEEERP
jgi:hypothetical protein